MPILWILVDHIKSNIVSRRAANENASEYTCEMKKKIVTHPHFIIANIKSCALFFINFISSMDSLKWIFNKQIKHSFDADKT